MSDQQLYLIQSLFTFMMTGVIWQVQLVTYPLFVDLRRFDKEGEAVRFLHECYTPRISWIVIPLMFGELFLSLYTLYRIPNPSSSLLFLPVLINWLTTFIFSVPLHGSMEKIDNLKTAQSLVKTNWIRTFFWTLRSVGLLTLLL
ncbi:MAG: hypothetical protein NXH75_18000 [Halobacteriovoraceae bacterium]|nr:hypothetical protein [Halobacteriovoraceae bacterium]